MRKKQTAKDAVSAATARGLASQSATQIIDTSVLTDEAVIVSDAMPQSGPPIEAEKISVPSVPNAWQQSSAIRKVDVTLGQVVSILLRSPQHRQRPLADLEWLVLPPILSGQFRVVQAEQLGVPVPVAVALWASVSAAVDLRLSDLSAPWRLHPDEWCSGDIPWLVEFVADTRTQQALIKHLGETVFKGRAIKMRVRGADGKMQIGTFKGTT